MTQVEFPLRLAAASGTRIGQPSLPLSVSGHKGHHGMSDEITRLELEALKNALKAISRQAPPNDVPIPFTEKGCRRVGEIISEVATATGENAQLQKRKAASD